MTRVEQKDSVPDSPPPKNFSEFVAAVSRNHPDFLPSLYDTLDTLAHQIYDREKCQREGGISTPEQQQSDRFRAQDEFFQIYGPKQDGKLGG